LKSNKWIGESTFKSMSGNLIPVLQVIVLHKDKSNNPSHISTTAINLSKIKEAERELLRVNTELTDLARHLQNISEIERKEIARDIHDELGQNLAVLNMKVAWIKKHLQDKPEELDQKIDELANSIKHTMTGFRRIHSALHPAMLEQLGLEATIKWLIKSIEESGNISIQFNCHLVTRDLKLDISLPIYRVIQEAFTNILRYAKATQIEINLSETANAIYLSIEDNGCGFIIEEVDSKLHHGILGMRERIYAVKGIYEIDSAIAKGTKINVKIPLAQ
jgi:signal transduction histidine kinase